MKMIFNSHRFFGSELLKLSALILAAVLLSSLQSAAQTRISIPSESKVEKDLIALCDIADVSGEKTEKMCGISLGYAPNIGMTREISRERIALSIAAAGFSAGEFQIKSPEIVRISRRGQHIDRSLIRAAIENAVADMFSSSALEIRIVRIDQIPVLEGPVGTVEVRTSLREVANPFAPFALPVEIRIDDRVFRRTAVNVELEGFADILVASRDLSTNSGILPDDVRIERRRLERTPAYYLRDFEKLRGVKLIKNISSGSEITADSFVSAVVVRSGDLVKIVGQSGAMQITVSGEARTSGKIGDRIAVKNKQSNAIIQATVIDEGFVKIYF